MSKRWTRLRISHFDRSMNCDTSSVSCPGIVRFADPFGEHLFRFSTDIANSIFGVETIH